MTASPEFFKGKKKAKSRPIFKEALDFLQQHQTPKQLYPPWCIWTRKRPICTFAFVPLTADEQAHRQGNRRQQEEADPVAGQVLGIHGQKYPDLERGESASQTGRDHIPPRVFKEMTRLTKQKAKLEELLSWYRAL